VTHWEPDLAHRAGPRYQALADAITEAIEAGRLAPGARLPTHRDLAYRLGVSVHTVSQAYAEARRRGDIVGETGRGTFVQARRPDNAQQFIMDQRQAGVIDLSILRPAWGEIHRGHLGTIFQALAATGEAESMLACRPIAGLTAHREAAAGWLGRLGVEVAPRHVLITNGIAHGMTVALSALVDPGDVVLCDRLTDHGVIALANVLNFRLQGLETDAEGITPAAFAAACERSPVRALVTTPTLNNPTLSLMGSARRREIAALARRHNVTIVEDDPYSVLVPEAPPPLWSFAPERTCYLTSFTKTAVSGLRTGYLAAPEPLIHRIVPRVRATAWMATPLLAEIATRWLADGVIEAMVAWQREALAARQAQAARDLAGHDLVWHPLALHAWLRMPRAWRAAHFVTQLKLRNLVVTSPEPFVVGSGEAPQAVRLCLGGAASLEELAAATGLIRDILAMGPEPAFLDL